VTVAHQDRLAKIDADPPARSVGDTTTAIGVICQLQHLAAARDLEPQQLARSDRTRRLTSPPFSPRRRRSQRSDLRLQAASLRGSPATGP